MKFFKFEINTIIFLGFIILTIVAWAGFEFFHRQNDIDISSELQTQAITPLPASFNSTTLKQIYESQDKYYETNPSATPTP